MMEQAIAILKTAALYVLVPYTTKVACGAHNHTATGAFREQITCKLCRESDEFKRLRNRPRKVSR